MTVQNDNGSLSTYSYDTTDQLTGEDTTGADGTYTYDANGNRTMSGYDTDADNRLASDGTWDYTYDAEGNMTEKDAVVGNVKWTYGYNHRNQLLRADRKSNGSSIDLTVNYTYDAWGNRVTKAVDLDGPGIGNPDVTFFALDGWNPANPTPIGTENFHVWADLAIDGSLKTRYLHGDEIDQLIARIDAVGTHPGTYWHLTDHLGSIRKIIDNAGAVRDSLTYNAFGTITAETDPDYRGRYTYTGREFEVETGLQYNRARFYDPSIGRWISKDPMGFAAGDSNLYRYVFNFCGMTDPSGKDPLPNPTGDSVHILKLMLDLGIGLWKTWPSSSTNEEALRDLAKKLSLPMIMFDDYLDRGFVVTQGDRSRCINGRIEFGVNKTQLKNNPSGAIAELYNELFHAYYFNVVDKSPQADWVRQLVKKGRNETYTDMRVGGVERDEMIEEAMSEMIESLASRVTKKHPEDVYPGMINAGFGSAMHSKTKEELGAGATRDERWSAEPFRTSANKLVPVYIRDLSLWIMQNGVESPQAGAGEAAIIKKLEDNWVSVFKKHDK